MGMQTAGRKTGNSAGDTVDMRLQDGCLIQAPLKQPARAGWADASRTIAADGDDALLWPEFGNRGDADLAW